MGGREKERKKERKNEGWVYGGGKKRMGEQTEGKKERMGWM